jgi:hypothetical protein
MGRRLVPMFALAVALLAAHAPAAIALPPVLGPESWTLDDPGLAPRHGHTITYDSVNNRLILFGGAIDVISSPNELNDVWELSLSGPLTWRRLQPTGTPPPGREGHTAVFDAANQRMLIYGGNGNQLHENADMWVLSLAGTPSWTRLLPGGTLPDHFHGIAPSRSKSQRMIVWRSQETLSDGARSAVLSIAGTPTGASWTHRASPEWRRQTATYDPVGQRMIVIGGGCGSNSTPAAMALSLNGPLQWSVYAPNGDMRDLNGHSAAYDPDDNSILVFGGFQTSGISNKTWRLALGASPAWTAVTPLGALPRRRRDHAAGYDPTAHRMLVFAGLLTTANAGDATEDEQERVVHPSGNPAWQELDPHGAAQARLPRRDDRRPSRPAHARDRRQPADGVFSNQHGKSTAGEQIWHPLGATGTPPTGRAGTPRSWTPQPAARHIRAAAGVGTSAFYTNEGRSRRSGPNPVWTHSRRPEGRPQRSDHSAIYDAAHQRMIVFGGVDNSGSMGTAGVVADQEPTWTQPWRGFPRARHGHSAIYDAPRNRMIVFGGASGGGIFSFPTPLGDLHAYALDGTNEWSVLNPPGPDPQDRYGHDAIYDPVGHRMLIFGGQTTTGMRQDAWSLPLWKPGASWKLLQPLGSIPFAVRRVRLRRRADMFVFGATPVETRPLFDMDVDAQLRAPPSSAHSPRLGAQPFGTTATFSVTRQRRRLPLAEERRVGPMEAISGALTSSRRSRASGVRRGHVPRAGVRRVRHRVE